MFPQVHDEIEMDRVLGIDGIQIIGINNRHLGNVTFFSLQNEQTARLVITT